MAGHHYLRLPINADEGFPQAFRLSFGGAVYRLSLYVNAAEDALASLPDPLLLPAPGAFMVLRVVREAAPSPVAILRRKLVPGLEYVAGDLAIQFTTMRVYKANLNGAGAFGSQVEGGVAAR